MLTLPDDTWLGFIYPSNYGRRKRGERLLVRIIAYELDDPHRPGHQVQSRLITTLLHPELYPALDLACLYHERWEVEIVIDEIDAHQRLVSCPLRSLKPVSVIQELYGCYSHNIHRLSAKFAGKLTLFIPSYTKKFAPSKAKEKTKPFTSV